MKSLLLLIALGAPALAHEPLRPVSTCLDPDRARSWHVIDSDEMLVDAGRQRFHLLLAPSCPELGFVNTVAFRSGDGVGRICGSAGDRVVMEQRSPVRVPCRIVEVTPLTKAQFEARLDDEPLHGTVEVREDAAQR